MNEWIRKKKRDIFGLILGVISDDQNQFKAFKWLKKIGKCIEMIQTTKYTLIFLQTDLSFIFWLNINQHNHLSFSLSRSFIDTATQKQNTM